MAHVRDAYSRFRTLLEHGWQKDLFAEVGCVGNYSYFQCHPQFTSMAGVKMTSRVYSLLYEGLSDEGKKKSRAKLDFVGPDVVDPYAVECSTNADDNVFPEVEYPNLYHYLVKAPSPVTKEELKAYKSLQGYQ